MIPNPQKFLPAFAWLLCASCLPSGAGSGGGAGGGAAQQPPVAAVATAGPAAGSGSSVAHYGFSVDPVDGRACLECHDGGLAPNIPTPRNFCKTSSSHPSFIAYPPAGRTRDFHPPGQVIAAGIRLPDGTITCISCHDIEKDTLHHLAVEDKGSRLCLTCHRI